MKIRSVVVLFIVRKRSLVPVGEEKLSQSGATTPTGGVTRHLFSFDIFTLFKSRLALESPGCLFVCSGVTLPKMAEYTE